jgi:hypothetical protein
VPILEFAGPLPNPALTIIFDAIYPPVFHHDWTADFVTERTAPEIAAIFEHGK